MFKKISLGVAVLCVISMIFISCSEGNKGTSNESDTTDSANIDAVAVNYLDALPSTDFGGYEFRFYIRQCCEAHYGGVYQESETGDVVNDAVYQRNRTMEEKFNIKVMESVLDQDGEPVIIRNAILANDHIADIVIPHFRYLGNMALENMLLDMGTLPYVDFNQPWWSTNLIENYSIFEKYYVAQGDIGIDNITYNGVIYFNKRLANEYLTENLYDVVRAGEWTLDKMNEVIRSVGQDLNGDGNIDIDNDQFGLGAPAGFFFMFQSAAGQPTTVRDADNIPQLAINTTKMVTIVEKVYNFSHGYEYSYIVENVPVNPFVQGHMLLYTNLINTATSNEFRDMEDDFGIIPFPKYDSEQKEYYSHASAHSSLLGIPITTPDTDRAGLLLEAFVYEGYNTIRPALYDIALKVKTTRDDDSAEMIDIVLQGRTGDFADIYDEWGLVYTLDHLVGRGKKTDFASYYASNENATLTRLSKAVEVFLGEE